MWYFLKFKNISRTFSAISNFKNIFFSSRTFKELQERVATLQNERKIAEKIIFDDLMYSYIATLHLLKCTSNPVCQNKYYNFEISFIYEIENYILYVHSKQSLKKNTYKFTSSIQFNT